MTRLGTTARRFDSRRLCTASVRRPTPPETTLSGRAFDSGRFGVLTVFRPCRADFEAADRAWAPLRSGDAEHNHWRWVDLVAYPERFGLRNAAGEIVCLWVCFKHRPLQLAGVHCYELDRVEVDPERVGQGLGAFSMLVIAARAREAGASAIVGCSLPQSQGFYEALGAQLVDGERCEEGTVAFRLESGVLEEMKERLDAVAV